MKLTARNITTLSLPAGKSDVIFWDDDCPGFGLRIREAGTRGWVFRYRFGNRQRSIKLGSAASISIATARANASKLEAEVRLGIDPAIKKALAKQEAENTFSLLAERFLDSRKRELREATIREYARHLRVDAKSLHRLPVAAVTQADVARLLNGDFGAATANRLRATLCAMFGWALKEGIILPHGNPAAYTHKRAEVARDRVLSDTELKQLWAALDDDDFGNIIKILTLTGQREEEIAKLKWSEIVEGSISLPAERVKNRRPHTIPLSDLVKKILTGRRDNRVYVFGRDDTGFSGFSQAKKRLDTKLEIPPWRIHDLRRTAASGMQRLGVRVEVIERALNHISGSYRGVAGIYQRDPMTAEVQDAMNRWARHVTALVEGRKSVVVSMKRA